MSRVVMKSFRPGNGIFRAVLKRPRRGAKSWPRHRERSGEEWNAIAGSIFRPLKLDKAYMFLSRQFHFPVLARNVPALALRKRIKQALAMGLNREGAGATGRDLQIGDLNLIWRIAELLLERHSAFAAAAAHVSAGAMWTMQEHRVGSGARARQDKRIRYGCWNIRRGADSRRGVARQPLLAERLREWVRRKSPARCQPEQNLTRFIERGFRA
jgi:hypothetical protein